MDVIKIRQLEIFANHGVFKEEKYLGQKFIISADLYTDIRKAGLSDDLNFSTDYGKVAETIKNFVESNIFNLIETVAEKLAQKLLIEFKNINKVKVEILKPSAPVKIHNNGFSVTIERGWKKVFLSLGSNMGEKQNFLNFAINELEKSDLCKVEKISDFIVTKPVGNVSQDDFLNACVQIKTLLTPYELLDFINKIENKAGRKRDIHWGPRTLDIDIIFYEDVVIFDENLKIPHIESANRYFVLKPLSQIAPFVIHPVYGKSVSELLEKVSFGSIPQN